MAQTTSLIFNGGVIPSPSPAPAGSGKAKLLKIGEISVVEQEVQVTKKVICDPDSVTTVAPFMEVLTSARLAELISANSILVLDDGTVQYLMADATIVVEDGTSVCTSVSFLGLSLEDRAKVLYPCTRITDELTLQQVLEVGEPVETGFDLVKAYPEDVEAGTLIDKLMVEDTVQGPDEQTLLEIIPSEDGEGHPKVAINEDNLRNRIDGIDNTIDGIIETIADLDVDSVPRAYLHSTINTSAGDSVTTSTTVNVFAVNALEGDCFEFEQTTTIDDTPFGYVWIEPGTYLINAAVTLQWVGNPRGTFIAKVGTVMGESFDFSQEQELKRQSTKVVTIPNRMKLAVNVTYDAGTPPMGFWIQSIQVVKLAGGMSQMNIVHDDTLVGQGSVADPIGVDEKKVAQSTLASNLAPEFDPTRTENDPYIAYKDSCVHEGELYLFKANHYGAWDINHVLHLPLSNLIEANSHMLSTKETRNKYIAGDGSVQNGTNFAIYDYDVSQGQNICIMTATGGGYCAFYDADNNVVGQTFRNPNDGYEFYSKNLTVPATAELLKVTCSTNNFKAPIVSIYGGLGDALSASTLLKNALVKNIVPEFDPLRTEEDKYKAGESVLYTDNFIYTFKVDHYGAWNATHVQRTDEFWRNAFARDAYQDGYIPGNSFGIGSLTPSDYVISLKVGCVPGQKFYIIGYVIGNASRLWCTYDDHGIIIRRSAPNIDHRTKAAIVEIQNGESGIAFNVAKNQPYFIACSVPNFIDKASSSLADVRFKTLNNSANTPIPYKKIVENSYVTSTGTIAGDPNFRVYEFSVNPGSKVHIKTGAGGGYIAFYDANGDLVGTPFHTSRYLEEVYYDTDIPTTATTLKVTSVKSQRDVNYFPSVISVDGYGMSVLLSGQKHLFAGKKILCIGDSITESAKWFSSLLEKTGALKIWNRGLSGSTLASYTNSTTSMCDRADLDSNDTDTAHGGGFPSDQNVDAVIVWGGTNDFGNSAKNVQFGSQVKVNKMEFIGAVFYLLNKLKTKYPTKPIYVCSILTAQKPGTGDWNRYTVSYGVYTERTNWTGKTITDYNATIKQICKMCGVHFIDMEMCGISPVINADYNNYFKVDGLHPNDDGGERIGRYIAENLVYDS